MMKGMPTTSGSLGIFWEGEEVDGVTIYGYWTGLKPAPPRVELSELPGAEAKPSRLDGSGWTVWLWDIRIQEWPDRRHWQGAIQGLLRQVMKGGAHVAWCGLEGMFVEPPGLFDPCEMSGGVWAAADKAGHMFGPPALDDAFLPLNDEQLSILRRSLR
jgi:hypothetical protein